MLFHKPQYTSMVVAVANSHVHSLLATIVCALLGLRGDSGCDLRSLTHPKLVRPLKISEHNSILLPASTFNGPAFSPYLGLSFGLPNFSSCDVSYTPTTSRLTVEHEVGIRSLMYPFVQKSCGVPNITISTLCRSLNMAYAYRATNHRLAIQQYSSSYCADQCC